MQLKALLVNGDPASGELLRQSLRSLGHEVVAECCEDTDLLTQVGIHTPDILVVLCNRPAGLLPKLGQLLLQSAVPVVLFTDDNDPEIIHRAVHAGVSAYIVDGLEAGRIGSILNVAVARFGAYEQLRRELLDTRANLIERKAVERAKGILMKQRGYDEPRAYHALRKMAMDKNLRIGEVAENVIAVADLLN